MKNIIINYFSRFRPLSQVEKDAIMEEMVIETFKKGDILLREGQIARDTYFVLKGCLRTYLLVDGEERTTNFFTEEQWVISAFSHAHEKPSNHYLVCVEDCTLIVGNEHKGNKVFEKAPKLEELSRLVLEIELGKQQEIMASHLSGSPEQRYLNLMNSNPDLLDRVPQYQLASYLGIKPESLSRIRKRIVQKSRTNKP